MLDGWRRWLPGPKHGLARGVAVYGAGRPEHVDELLGRCERLRAWARVRGFELTGVPADLDVLDQALAEPASAGSLAAVANEVGLFLGAVIVASVPGARWRRWPNGHPVVGLARGGDLDVIAIAHESVSSGAPLLADTYAAVAGPGSR